MKKLYESLLDDDDELMKRSEEGVEEYFKHLYLKDVLNIKDYTNSRYNDLVKLDLSSSFIQLSHPDHINILQKVPLIINQVNTEKLCVNGFYLEKENKDIFDYISKSFIFNSFTNKLSHITFETMAVPEINNFTIKSKFGVSELRLWIGFKNCKNLTVDMGDVDDKIGEFAINLGLANINSWDIFKEFHINNKTPNNRINKLCIKVCDTPLIKKFARKVPIYNPIKKPDVSLEEIQQKAMDYFYKEIEPNIKHINGLGAVYMYIKYDGHYSVKDSWRGFIKQENGVWEYIDHTFEK